MPTPKVNSLLGWQNFTVNTRSTYKFTASGREPRQRWPSSLISWHYSPILSPHKFADVAGNLILTLPTETGLIVVLVFRLLRSATIPCLLRAVVHPQPPILTPSRVCPRYAATHCQAYRCCSYRSSLLLKKIQREIDAKRQLFVLSMESWIKKVARELMDM
jgi:hypothetical protein